VSVVKRRLGRLGCRKSGKTGNAFSKGYFPKETEPLTKRDTLRERGRKGVDNTYTRECHDAEMITGGSPRENHLKKKMKLELKSSAVIVTGGRRSGQKGRRRIVREGAISPTDGEDRRSIPVRSDSELSKGGEHLPVKENTEGNSKETLKKMWPG